MFKRAILITVSVLFLEIHAQSESKRPAYPPSKTEEVVDTLHGVKIADPYRWLEKGDDPTVKEWTAKQNAFTRESLDKLTGRDRLREKLDQLLDVGTLSVAVPKGSRIFFTKRDGKQNQPILYVQEEEGEPRVLVDPNPLSKDGTVTLDWWFPGPEGKLIAYGLSSSGSEQSTLRVRDVETGKDLPDVIERTRACSLAWTPDGKGLYYTRYPKPGSVPKGEENYNRRVFFHKLGDNPADDELLFGKGRDPAEWPQIALSPDGRWLVVMVQKGWAMTEVYVKDLLKNEEFFPLVESVPAVFRVVPRDDRFFILTDENAPRYRLMSVEIHKWDRANWKEVIAEGRDVLENAAPIGEHIAALYLHEASSKLKILDKKGDVKRDVELPGLGTVSAMAGEANGHELFFTYQSYVDSPSIRRLDLRTAKGEAHAPIVVQQVKSNIDPASFNVERVKYPSRDGTLIPLTLISKNGTKKDGKTPTVLYGYGGFNISLTPTFNPTRFLTICEYGGIMAIANLRGGGEFGEKWHAAGMLGNKQNVFDDIIAAGDYLIKEKCTDKDHLAIMGRSNGGLLVGAAVTQRPGLFKAAICGVPLLDMVRYHHFLIAKLWIPEYGDPGEPKEFPWLHAYSPYHRVREGVAYPAILFTTAESDTRVDPLHARKMTALMQAATSSANPILLRLEEKAGHGQGKPRSKLLDEEVDVWSFLLNELGVKP